MGGCCSKQLELEGVVGGEIDGAEDGDDARIEDGGSRVWLQGNSRCTSMFTQGGRKGINQDAMTVWEVKSSLIFPPSLYTIVFFSFLGRNLSYWNETVKKLYLHVKALY